MPKVAARFETFKEAEEARAKLLKADFPSEAIQVLKNDIGVGEATLVENAAIVVIAAERRLEEAWDILAAVSGAHAEFRKGDYPDPK